MQVSHQIRALNVSTLTTLRILRPAKRPRIAFIDSSWRNRGCSAGLSLPGTKLSVRLVHKLRSRLGLVFVSPLHPVCSDMSVRRPYSTNRSSIKERLVGNGTEKSLGGGSPREPPHDPEHHHSHNHEAPHSHSHSIFGHSHSNETEAHTHGTEQIIAALEGKGLSIRTYTSIYSVKYLQGIEAARSHWLD